jgi:nicotinamide mononucleotide adenylyltransferase
MTIDDRTNGMLSEHELREYKFPTEALTLTLSPEDRGKTPLAIVACGSFSPLSYLHLRLFEMAKDWAKQSGQYAVVGLYISPVGDGYGKKDLAPAVDRVNMCKLGTSSSNIMVDNWEGLQSKYQVTAQVR